jgi:hypothetical protein
MLDLTFVNHITFVRSKYFLEQFIFKSFYDRFLLRKKKKDHNSQAHKTLEMKYVHTNNNLTVI